MSNYDPPASTARATEQTRKLKTRYNARYGLRDERYIRKHTAKMRTTPYRTRNRTRQAGERTWRGLSVATDRDERCRIAHRGLTETAEHASVVVLVLAKNLCFLSIRTIPHRDIQPLARGLHAEAGVEHLCTNSNSDGFSAKNNTHEARRCTYLPRFHHHVQQT